MSSGAARRAPLRRNFCTNLLRRFDGRDSLTRRRCDQGSPEAKATIISADRYRFVIAQTRASSGHLLASLKPRWHRRFVYPSLLRRVTANLAHAPPVYRPGPTHNGGAAKPLVGDVFLGKASRLQPYGSKIARLRSRLTHPVMRANPSLRVYEANSGRTARAEGHKVGSEPGSA